jgi:hypothetical protein
MGNYNNYICFSTALACISKTNPDKHENNTDNIIIIQIISFRSMCVH